MSATTMPVAEERFHPAPDARGKKVAVLGRMLVAPPAPMPITELQARAGLTPREAKKMDRFSMLTLAAVHPLVASLDDADRRDCGIISGNSAAGWSYTEPQLQALHAEGTTAVSPYLASAWFPAAPQGQVTIHLGLRGFAKTIATDRCAGMQAIAHAASRIAAGRARLLLAGGTEAPVTPFVRRAVEQDGGDAALLAEAAAFVLLGAAGDGDAVSIGHHASWPLPRCGVRSALEEHLVRERDDIGDLDHVVCCCDPADEGLSLVMRAIVRRTFGRTAAMHFPLRERGDSLGASSAVATHYAIELLARSCGTALVFTVGRQSAGVLSLCRDLD